MAPAPEVQSGASATQEPGPASTLGADLVSVAYVVGGLLTALGILALFRAGSDALTKVAVGLLLAAALDPLVVRARRTFHWTRTGAVALVASILVGAFAAIVLLLAPPAIRQAQDLTDELPATVERTYSWPLVGQRLADAEAAEEVDRFLDELPGRIDDNTIGTAAEAALGGVQTLTAVLITAIAVMVDGEALVARVRRLISPGRRDRADEIGRIVYRTVGNYFAGSLLVAVINGLVILTAGLVLGVPLTPLAAIWATLTNLIPQVGGLLGGSFFVLLAITQGPVVGLAALATYLVYQQVESNIVQPAVVGKAVNLSPPTTMLAALVGGAAAGVPGALAATPLVGTAKAIYLELRRGPPPDSQQAGHDPGHADDAPRSLRRPERASG